MSTRHKSYKKTGPHQWCSDWRTLGTFASLFTLLFACGGDSTAVIGLAGVTQPSSGNTSNDDTPSVESIGTLTANPVSNTEIDLSWTGITESHVFIIVAEGSTPPTDCSDGVEVINTSTYSATGLSPGTPYSFALCREGATASPLATNVVSGTTNLNFQDPDSQTVKASTGLPPRDSFGQAVAVLGSQALVGNPSPDRQPNSPGVVYAFSLVGGIWNLTQTFSDTNPANSGTGDAFGFSIVMYKNGAVIGAPLRKNVNGSSAAAGAVFYFENTGGTWSQSAMVTAGTVDKLGNDSSYFGSSVALSDGVILVGASSQGMTNGAGVQTASYVGEAYLYEGSGSTWAQTKRFVASDRSDGAEYGYSVAVSGSQAFIGAIGATVNNTGHGAVYVYDRASGWGNETKLGTGPDVNASNFGLAMSLSGSLLAVADPGYNSNQGQVYIFSKLSGAWSLDQTISGPASPGGGSFGFSLALDGQRLVIGAPYENQLTTTSAGAYYLYQSSGGTFNLVRRVYSDTPQASEYYGYAIALSGNTALVGSNFSTDNISQVGTSYFVDETHVPASPPPGGGIIY